MAQEAAADQYTVTTLPLTEQTALELVQEATWALQDHMEAVEEALAE